jgi:hypothetical protein
MRASWEATRYHFVDDLFGLFGGFDWLHSDEARLGIHRHICVNNSYNHMNIFRNIDKSYCYIAETTSVECRYDNYESSGDNIICIVENGY